MLEVIAFNMHYDQLTVMIDRTLINDWTTAIECIFATKH
jgi:hypothetical protein